jgi:hypothetical protein
MALVFIQTKLVMDLPKFILNKVGYGLAEIHSKENEIYSN